MSYSIRRWRQLANSPAVRCSREEFLIIGPTPHDETCTPAGANLSEGLLECRVYASLLERVFDAVPEGCEIVVIESVHDDAGIYHEVGITYTTVEGVEDFWNNEFECDEARTQLEAAEKCETYALAMEHGCTNWDDQALSELREAEHSLYTAKVVKLKAA